MTPSAVINLTPLPGIRYFTPQPDFVLSGRDGMVCIPWAGKPPIPHLEDDFSVAQQAGVTDYDMVGRGIYQALRLDPDCACSEEYAALLKDAYPHIVSELGGQIVMLDARDVDTPYLDRKINFLKIMVLFDPGNGDIHLEIARTYSEKGSRLSNLNQAVQSWYAAEKHLKEAVAKAPENRLAVYEYGEALYLLGRYEQAAAVWQSMPVSGDENERRRIEGRIAEILTGKLPLVPPVDYLTAIAVAVENHYGGRNDDAAAIIEDVLGDAVFAAQFPLGEVYHLLGTCYQEMGMLEEAAGAFRKS